MRVSELAWVVFHFCSHLFSRIERAQPMVHGSIHLWIRLRLYFIKSLIHELTTKHGKHTVGKKKRTNVLTTTRCCMSNRQTKRKQRTPKRYFFYLREFASLICSVTRARASPAPSRTSPSKICPQTHCQTLGMRNRQLIGRQRRVNHNTLVYQYWLCYIMSLYCTIALSRSVI